MRVIRGILIGIGVCAVAFGVLYFTLQKIYEPKFPGTWELVTDNEGCFTEVTFSGGTPSYQGITFDEVKGNTKTWYSGKHTIKGDQITVEVNNFESIEPFDMTYEKDGDDLHLKYHWNDEDFTCGYKLESE